MNEGVRRIKMTAILAAIGVFCILMFRAAGNTGMIDFPSVFASLLAAVLVWCAITFVAWIVEGFAKKAN
jgi:hypothetical protein